MKKTPREELMESLCENAKAFRALPVWLRSSVSNERIFAAAPTRQRSQSDNTLEETQITSDEIAASGASSSQAFL